MPEGPRHVIKLEVIDSRSRATNVISLGEGHALDPKYYELRVKSGSQEVGLPVTVTALDDDNVSGYVSTLTFAADRSHSFSTNNTYTLRILPKALYLKGVTNAVPLNESENLDKPLANSKLALDEDFLEPQTIQNRIEVLGGTAGGVASFQYRKDINNINDRSWLNASINLHGDFNFQAKDKADYFNSLVGEAKVFVPFKWSLPGSPATDLKRARYSEFDIHARFESDQTFENADRLLGVSLGTFTKDPISKFLGRYLLLNGRKTTEASVSPMLIFGYDYAKNLITDPAATNRLDTHEGNHRVFGTLYWSLPLGREVNLGFAGIQKSVDVDALFELHGIYDFHAEKFLDQSRISLNASPHAIDKPRLVYSLSWERGKAGPTFKDVQTVLAGLKVNF
jgi:hypothetical protein